MRVRTSAGTYAPQTQLGVVFTGELLRVQNYLREKAGVSSLPDPDTMLMCSQCHQWKEDDSFYRNTRYLKKGRRRGRGDQCKKCNDAWRARNREQNNGRDNERNRLNRLRKKGDVPMATCVGCRGLVNAKTVFVHLGKCQLTQTPDAILPCSRCHLWKPDDEYPLSRRTTSRRGRYNCCRDCDRKRRDERLDSQEDV